MLNIGMIDYEVDIGGPGVRTEIFLQGCYQNCPGCFNPSLKPHTKVRELPVEEIVRVVTEFTPNKLVTIGGGEPLIQAEGLYRLVMQLKQHNFHILMYSGLTWEEITRFTHGYDDWNYKLFGKPKPSHLDMDEQSRLMAQRFYLLHILQCIDVLVDGPFEQDTALPIEPGKFVGSTNQRIIDVPATLRNKNNIITYKEADK